MVKGVNCSANSLDDSTGGGKKRCRLKTQRSREVETFGELSGGFKKIRQQERVKGLGEKKSAGEGINFGGERGSN